MVWYYICVAVYYWLYYSVISFWLPNITIILNDYFTCEDKQHYGLLEDIGHHNTAPFICSTKPFPVGDMQMWYDV